MRLSIGKRTAAAVAAALLVVSLAPANAIAAPGYRGYSDVDSDDWYVTSGIFDYTLDHGLMSGYSGTTLFGPYDTVTRGQVAVVLWRLAGSPTASSADFGDVDYGIYYGAAIRWARSTGVVNGYAGTNYFGPDDNVSREQLVTMLYNYASNVADADVAASDSEVSRISGWDSVSDWARESFAWAFEKGIVSGVSTSSGPELQPQGNAWRASMASMSSALRRDVLKLDDNNNGNNGGGNNNNGGNNNGGQTAKVNYTALDDAIAKASGLKQANYTDASWAALSGALKSAQDVRTKQGATQAEVDSAAKALQGAIDGLVFVGDKKSEYELVSSQLDSTQKDLDSAKAGLSEASSRVEDAGKAVDNANSEVKKATGDYGRAAEYYQQVEPAYRDAVRLQKAAQQKYDDAKAALENAQSNSSSQLNAEGFFTYVVDDSSATSAQKADAQAALDTLLGKKDRPSWYDSKVNLSDPSGAATGQALKETLSYYDALNGLREENGLSTLNVSLELVAQSMVNSYYSANTIGHSQHYSGWENIAWGDYGAYDGGNTEATLKGAMASWYSEKSIYEQAISAGSYNGQSVDSSYLENNRNSSYSIFSKYPNLYNATGHYLNFIDSGVRSMGFAVNHNASYGGEVLWRGNSSTGSMSADQYQNLLNEYLSSGGSGSDLSAYQAAVDDAKKQLDDANSRLSSATDDYNTAKKNSSAASKAIDDAMAKRDEATAELKKAQAAKEDAEKKVEDLKKKVDDLQKRKDELASELGLNV